MKIRNGFVSNSSSSSFVATTKEGADKLISLIENHENETYDYKEMSDGRVITSPIHDSSTLYGDICNLMDKRTDIDDYDLDYPNEYNSVEYEGDRGCVSVYVKYHEVDTRKYSYTINELDKTITLKRSDKGYILKFEEIEYED